MNIFNKASSAIKLLKMSNFSKPKLISIQEIPDNWEKFPLIEGDEWVKVILPPTENILSCLYRVKTISTFPPHKHLVDETIIVTNKNGEIEIITTEGSVTLKYGESYTIPANVVHSAILKPKTKIMCLWLGVENDSWDATFPKNIEI